MKTIHKHFVLVFLACLCASGLFAQNKAKLAKANREFDKYDYIDAREIYLKVVEDGYHSAEIYKKLGDTYYYNSDYVTAVKWYDRLLKTYPDNIEVDYYYRAAQSFKSLDRVDESNRLLKVYLEMGGEVPEVQLFENNPEYMKKLGLSPSKYVVEEVETNTKFSDFGPAYYGNQLVFSASTRDLSNFDTHNWNNLPYLDLFMADMDSEGHLSNLDDFSSDVNTVYHESTPVFSKDLKTMYFTRNNFTNGKAAADKKRTIKLKLYKATRTDSTSWGNVKELPFNNNEYSVGHPALSLDEKRLYFASDMPGTYGRSDLWYVDILSNDSYGLPVNLGPDINSKSKETFPFISEKGNLYFSANGYGGEGGLDVYIATFNPLGRVEQITNFGPPVNTPQDDFAFIIRESEKMGFFTSNRDGGRGSVDDEIYKFTEVCVMNIIGVVTDEDTGELLPGAEVTLMDQNSKVIEKVIADENASYRFVVECSTKYVLRGTKEGYFPKEESVETPDEGGVIETELKLKLKDPCPPNDLGCRLSLQPIYFDYDKDYIRPDAEIELAKILMALRLYPQLVINIESHTDARGRDSYNMKLSERRAQSTLNWLIEKGIEPTRLSAKGYGETQLQNRCSNDVECTEEEHQLNRRSMFIIVN